MTKTFLTLHGKKILLYHNFQVKQKPKEKKRKNDSQIPMRPDIQFSACFFFLFFNSLFDSLN